MTSKIYSVTDATPVSICTVIDRVPISIYTTGPIYIAPGSSSISSSPSSSPSPSSSLSGSPSTSLSSSPSTSLSGSPSTSLSSSPSTSLSGSPSMGAGYYSMQGMDPLPLDDADLSVDYSDQDYTDVETYNGVFVGIADRDVYLIHQFKDYIGNAPSAQATCTLKSELAASYSPVYLQVYNHNTTSWETKDSNNTAAADVDFSLNFFLSDVTNYVSNNFLSCRVYQWGG